MDQLVLANSTTTSEVENKLPTMLKDVMMNFKRNDGFGGHHINGYTKLHNELQ
jgi:hypothetical protein